MKPYQELKSMGIDFNSLENERQEALLYRKNKSNPVQIIGFASIVVGIAFLYISIIIGIAILSIGLIVAFVYYSIINSNAQKQVKSKIINDFFGKLNMNLVYGNASKEKEFKKNIYKVGFITGDITSEDFISGNLNEQPFVMGDVKISYDDDDTVNTLFQGPIGFIQTSNNYPYTTILPDKPEKTFGGFGKLMQKANLLRLNQKSIFFHEDPDFERHFVVWSKDEDFARNILIDPLRKYLRELAAINNVYLVFRENLIMFAMDIHRDLFNLKLDKPIDDAVLSLMYDDFAKFYQFIENIYSLVTTGDTSIANVNQSTNNISPKPNDEVLPPLSF